MNLFLTNLLSSCFQKIELLAQKVVKYILSAIKDDCMYGHGTNVAETGVGKRSDDRITETRGAADGIAPSPKIGKALIIH